MLDPFNGSDQTTKMARHLDVITSASDTQPEYIEFVKKGLSEPLYLREQIVAEWKKIARPLR